MISKPKLPPVQALPTPALTPSPATSVSSPLFSGRGSGIGAGIFTGPLGLVAPAYSQKTSLIGG